jgi:MFS family permease
LAKQLGATDVTQSIMATLNIALIVLGNTIVTTVVRRLGSYRMLYVSFIFIAIGLAVASIAFSLSLVFTAIFFIGLAWGLGYPLLMGMSIEHVDDTQRATAMGIHQAIYGIGMFSGPWLSGIFADIIGIRATLAANALGCLVLGLFGTYQLTRMHKHLDVAR